jgi:Lon protease-like protein
MFPLGTVLFPHAIIPLHIFEPRYRVLVHDCLRGQPIFGVVLIERGNEVGGGDTRFGTGTAAHIERAAELPDGRWVLEAVGTQRFDVLEWLADDPYPRASIQWREEKEKGLARPERLDEAERAVRHALALTAELGEPAVAATVELDTDPQVRGWQLAAIAPVGPVDRQHLLGLDDPGERLAALARLADEEATVLAYRLSGG